MEFVVKALTQAGLSQIDAVRTYFTLISFILVQASYQCRGPYPDLEPSKRIRSECIAGRGYNALEQVELPEEWDFDLPSRSSCRPYAGLSSGISTPVVASTKPFSVSWESPS